MKCDKQMQTYWESVQMSLACVSNLLGSSPARISHEEHLHAVLHILLYTWTRHWGTIPFISSSSRDQYHNGSKKER